MVRFYLAIELDSGIVAGSGQEFPDEPAIDLNGSNFLDTGETWKICEMKSSKTTYYLSSRLNR